MTPDGRVWSRLDLKVFFNFFAFNLDFPFQVFSKWYTLRTNEEDTRSIKCRPNGVHIFVPLCSGFTGLLGNCLR